MCSRLTDLGSRTSAAGLRRDIGLGGRESAVPDTLATRTEENGRAKTDEESP